MALIEWVAYENKKCLHFSLPCAGYQLKSYTILLQKASILAILFLDTHHINGFALCILTFLWELISTLIKGALNFLSEEKNNNPTQLWMPNYEIWMPKIRVFTTMTILNMFVALCCWQVYKQLLFWNFQRLINREGKQFWNITRCTLHISKSNASS